MAARMSTCVLFCARACSSVPLRMPLWLPLNALQCPRGCSCLCPCVCSSVTLSLVCGHDCAGICGHGFWIMCRFCHGAQRCWPMVYTRGGALACRRLRPTSAERVCRSLRPARKIVCARPRHVVCRDERVSVRGKRAKQACAWVLVCLRKSQCITKACGHDAACAHIGELVSTHR